MRNHFVVNSDFALLSGFWNSIFGAWFAQVLIQTGIAESVIRSAAELAGDRPFITAIEQAYGGAER